MTEIYVPDMTDLQENLNKPVLDPGDYLAVIVGVASKANPAKNSLGLNWSLLVNSDPASVTNGWNAEAHTLPMDYYTYIGKTDNDGNIISEPKAAFRTAKFLATQGISGSFKVSEVKHRQVIVRIGHEPSMEDQEALKANPTHVVARFFAKVQDARAYRINDQLGPKLPNLDDGSPDEPPKVSAGGEF